MIGLFPYEDKLFFLINGTHNQFLDNAMLLYSGFLVWLPAMLALAFVIVYKHSWRQWLPVMGMLAVVFTLSALLSSGITKPLFGRLRPIYYTDIMDQVRTLYTHTGGIYGFISGHTTHTFGFAVATSLLFRNRWYTLVILLWATIMGFSRIYLGMHFVTDIIGGMVIGSLVGWFAYMLYRSYTDRRPQTAVCYGKRRISRFALMLTAYIFLFSAFGGLLVKVLV